MTLYKLDNFLDGDLDEIIDGLITSDQAEKMKAFLDDEKPADSALRVDNVKQRYAEKLTKRLSRCAERSPEGPGGISPTGDSVILVWGLRRAQRSRRDGMAERLSMAKGQAQR